MCGPFLGSIVDPYGQPSDASAVSATTGNIAVGNIFDTSGDGSVSVCTLTSGTCSTNLTNPAILEVGGVGMAANGDCWANAINSDDVAVLVYFAGCSGAGVVATGFVNPFYGSVDVDGKGNLVTVSLFGPSFSLPSVVYVYSGCNPACTLISESPLTGESIFGHLGKAKLTVRDDEPRVVGCRSLQIPAVGPHPELQLHRRPPLCHLRMRSCGL